MAKTFERWQQALGLRNKADKINIIFQAQFFLQVKQFIAQFSPADDDKCHIGLLCDDNLRRVQQGGVIFVRNKCRDISDNSFARRHVGFCPQLLKAIFFGTETFIRGRIVNHSYLLAGQTPVPHLSCDEARNANHLAGAMVFEPVEPIVFGQKIYAARYHERAFLNQVGQSGQTVSSSTVAME